MTVFQCKLLQHDGLLYSSVTRSDCLLLVQNWVFWQLVDDRLLPGHGVQLHQPLQRLHAQTDSFTCCYTQGHNSSNVPTSSKREARHLRGWRDSICARHVPSVHARVCCHCQQYNIGCLDVVREVHADLTQACHGFHAGTAWVYNDGQQERHPHSNADAADAADGHLQGACTGTRQLSLSELTRYKCILLTLKACAK